MGEKSLNVYVSGEVDRERGTKDIIEINYSSENEFIEKWFEILFGYIDFTKKNMLEIVEKAEIICNDYLKKEKELLIKLNIHK